MPSIEFIQQLIYSVALALFLVYLSRLPRYSLFFSSLLFVLLMIGVNLVPLYRGSSLVELLRGGVGDVSTASGGLMILVIINQFHFAKERITLLSFYEKLCLIILGLLLYLSTFGFISFDIYHLGYLSPAMLLFFAGIIFVLIIFNHSLGYAWLLALIGFYYKIQASNNLWDYLYDPLLWLVLLVDSINYLLSRLNSRKSY